jgi:glutamate---methylamine ligase
MAAWSDIANKQGIKYFLVSFVDLFGTMRAKLVPAPAMDSVARSGAGFAGFAVWFDMTPAEAGSRMGRLRPRHE